MILDHIENLEVAETGESEHYEARMALARLGEGLFGLYEDVLSIENKVRKRAEKDHVQFDFVGGVLDGFALGRLSCAFQWYAVSACNYAQLVGWLTTLNTQGAKDYVARVMPRLQNYRNKLAAHFAMTDPRRDNEADMAASLLTQVIYVKGRLLAGALTPVLEDTGVTADCSWSLTVAHEGFRRRFWPEGVPKAYQTIRVPPGESEFHINYSHLLENE